MLLPAGVDIHRFVPHRPNTNSNKSSNSSSHESVTTGRQQAVDAILDASSEGSYYRAMNIQVDAIPTILRSRPILFPFPIIVALSQLGDGDVSSEVQNLQGEPKQQEFIDAKDDYVVENIRSILIRHYYRLDHNSQSIAEDVLEFVRSIHASSTVPPTPSLPDKKSYSTIAPLLSRTKSPHKTNSPYVILEQLLARILLATPEGQNNFLNHLVIFCIGVATLLKSPPADDTKIFRVGPLLRYMTLKMTYKHSLTPSYSQEEDLSTSLMELHQHTQSSCNRFIQTLKRQEEVEQENLVDKKETALYPPNEDDSSEHQNSDDVIIIASSNTEDGITQAVEGEDFIPPQPELAEAISPPFSSSHSSSSASDEEEEEDEEMNHSYDELEEEEDESSVEEDDDGHHNNPASAPGDLLDLEHHGDDHHVGVDDDDSNDETTIMQEEGEEAAMLQAILTLSLAESALTSDIVHESDASEDIHVTADVSNTPYIHRQLFHPNERNYSASIVATYAGTASDRSELQSNRSEWGGTDDGAQESLHFDDHHLELLERKGSMEDVVENNSEDIMEKEHYEEDTDIQSPTFGNISPAVVLMEAILFISSQLMQENHDSKNKVGVGENLNALVDVDLLDLLAKLLKILSKLREDSMMDLEKVISPILKQQQKHTCRQLKAVEDIKSSVKLFSIACALSLRCIAHVYTPQPFKERQLLSSYIYTFTDSKQSVLFGNLWQQYPKQSLPRTLFEYALEAFKQLWAAQFHKDRVSSLLEALTKLHLPCIQHQTELVIPWSKEFCDTAQFDAMCCRMCQMDCFGDFFSNRVEDFDLLIAFLTSVSQYINNNQTSYSRIPHFCRLYKKLLRYSSEYFILHTWTPTSGEAINDLHLSKRRLDVLLGTSVTLDQLPQAEAKLVTSHQCVHHSTNKYSDKFGVGVQDSDLEFEPDRCGDSISISQQMPRSASQRGSKVWGTVCCKVAFSPNTGKHSWAVHLDKCEKGHIFVGVVTGQASTKTYLGGDAFGWGVIGTRALWHDRAKIRSDYGASFRTGTTVIATLDTCVGSLKFGIIRDSSSSVPVFEDWGVAFEGLPLNAKLHPAVGLYQRDDCVTLTNVESAFGRPIVTGQGMIQGLSSLSLDRTSHSDPLTERWNSAAVYIYAIVELFIDRVTCFTSASYIVAPHEILQSVFSTLLLFPNACVGKHNSLLAQFSLRCLPLLTWILKSFKMQFSSSSRAGHGLSSSYELLEGCWQITRNKNLQDSSKKITTKSPTLYTMELQHKVTQPESSGCKTVWYEGAGRIPGQVSEHSQVFFHGMLYGTGLTFVEQRVESPRRSEDVTVLERNNGSFSPLCNVGEARVHPSGKSFTGFLYNVASGRIEEEIRGTHLSTETESTLLYRENRKLNDLLDCAYLCSQAIGNLTLVLMQCNDIVTGSIFGDESHDENPKRSFQRWLRSPLFSGGLRYQGDDKNNVLFSQINNGLSAQFQNFFTPLKQKRPYWAMNSAIFSDWIEGSQLDIPEADSEKSPPVEIETLASLDSWVQCHPGSGGPGSLSVLSPLSYKSTRLKIIQCILYHCQLERHVIIMAQTGQTPSEILLFVWSCALNCLESEIRSCIQTKEDGATLELKCCKAFRTIEQRLQYLMKLEPSSVVNDEGNDAVFHCRKSIVRDIADFLTSTITASDWEKLTREMEWGSLSAEMKTFWITSSLKVVKSSSERDYLNSGNDLNIFSTTVIDGLCAFFPSLLSHVPTAEFSCIANLSLNNLPAHRNFDGLTLERYGCSRFALNRLLSSIFNTCAYCGGEIAKAIKQNDFYLLNHSRFQSRIISSLFSLLVIFCIPALGFLSGNCVEYPIVEAAHLIDLWSSLSQIRCRLGLILSTPLAGYDTPDALIRRAFHELYHSTWVVIQLLAAQSMQVHHDELGKIPSEKKFYFDIVMKACLEGSVKLFESLQIDSSKYWATTGKKNARASFELYCKMNDIDFVGKNHQSTASEPLASLIPKHLFSWLHNSSRRIIGESAIQETTQEVFILRPFMTYSYRELSSLLDVTFVLGHKIGAQGYRSLSSALFQSIIPLLGYSKSSSSLQYQPSLHLSILQVRLLRLLRLLLPSSCIDPSKGRDVVEMLLVFSAMPAAVNTELDIDDEVQIEREAVSLLKYLFSVPRESCFFPWHLVIVNTVRDVLDGSEQSNGKGNILMKGARIFLSGQCLASLRLKVGSFVLLPTVGLSAPYTKLSSSGSTQHAYRNSLSSHATGSPLYSSSVTSVLTGLSRTSIPAGIVSCIDVGKGSAEVLFYDRHIPASFLKKNFTDVEVDPFSERDRNETTYIRNSLISLRAVKVNMADLVLVDEFILFDVSQFSDIAFKSSISVIERSRNSLCAAKSNDANATTEPEFRLDNPLEAAMMFRTFCHLLSNKYTIQSFLASMSDVSLWRNLLEIAVVKSSNESLLRLNKREAKLSFLYELQRELQRAMYIINCYADVESWQHEFNERLAENNRLECGTKQLLQPATPSDIESILETPLRAEDSNHTNDATCIEAENKAFSADAAVSVDRSETKHAEQGSQDASAAGVANDERSTAKTEEIDATAAEAEVNGEEGTDEVTAESEIQLSEEDIHLREAATAQMAELGLPRSWALIALKQTATRSIPVNVEAAVHFCLEQGGIEMERLVRLERSNERQRRQARQSSSTDGRIITDSLSSRSVRINAVLQQLFEMGFPSQWCAEALAATGNNVDEALSWILANGERLSGTEDSQDVGGSGEDKDNDEEDESEIEYADIEKEAIGEAERSDLAHSGNIECSVEGLPQLNYDMICPLRFVSGHSSVDRNTLVVSGLSSGGFSSVGTRGVLLTAGKWYYEAHLITAGCLQIGWADNSFLGHCHADRGDGCGDGPSSWAYDGWRRYKWHGTATEWGSRWAVGDIVGCCADLDQMTISFTLNGRSEEIGMGVAFTHIRPVGGLYACVSFNRKERIRLSLGSCFGTFQYGPPKGYRCVAEAILDAQREYDDLRKCEQDCTASFSPMRYLCNFSEGEHGHELFAWQHRYYGSDASVHLGSSKSTASVGREVPRIKSEKSVLSVSAAAQELVSIILTRDGNGLSDDRSFDTSTILGSFKVSEAVASVLNGYKNAIQKVDDLIHEQCHSIIPLYARKLILQIVASTHDSSAYTEMPAHFIKTPFNDEYSALCLINILLICGSHRSAGWVGEPGTMALAAESLGLGISSGQSNLKGMGPRGSQSSDALAGKFNALLDTEAGTVRCSLQLSSAAILEPSSADVTVDRLASAEPSLLVEGGSVFVFLREGLQSILRRSSSARKVFVAKIRRMVRKLSVVEFSRDDDSSLHSEESIGEHLCNENIASSDGRSSSAHDARLASYLTGLLLSIPVCGSISDVAELNLHYCNLFEAWSVGLLSVSAPWRLICAYTAAGILNICPDALKWTVSRFPSLRHVYVNLGSLVARRLWAERAALPICSQYAQSYVDLLTSVHNTKWPGLPKCLKVDSATPISISSPDNLFIGQEMPISWEASEGWVCCDSVWEIWIGILQVFPVEWSCPPLYTGQTLIDGGEGPPMLKEGCFVMRGVDWDQREVGKDNKNEDGKDVFEAAKESRKRDLASFQGESAGLNIERTAEEAHNNKAKPKPSKVGLPKLPIGTVISIEPWKGVPCLARRVRWHLTGIEGVYRWGGDGGCFDIVHVDVNEKQTRVRKRYQLPESMEQCAVRHGFGTSRKFAVLFRMRKDTIKLCSADSEDREGEGILEYPDFGAGVRVLFTLHRDGAVSITEDDLLWGSRDNGWEGRFGQPAYKPGSLMVVTPTCYMNSCPSDFNQFEMLLGSDSFIVDRLRNKEDKSRLRISSELRLYRSRRRTNVPKLATYNGFISASELPPICFDDDFKPSYFSLSHDRRTITCTSVDGRGTAFASVGFTKGVHYWEVMIEQADIGSVFIGVAEKPPSVSITNSSSNDNSHRFHRWVGHGFVNFRATYNSGAERVYGAHAHAGDIVGVLLDCDAGRLSFFLDGVKYGEHLMNDLGCAFENLSPFGFNADGCGSGGAGQGAPNATDRSRDRRYSANGVVRPRSLWPVIGLRSLGDRVTLGTKWISGYGPDGIVSLRNIVAADEVLRCYERSLSSGYVSFDKKKSKVDIAKRLIFPPWFVKESYIEYQRWRSSRWYRTATRGSGSYRLSSFGLDVDLDMSPLSCACACASLGLKYVLLPGDTVIVKRSAGRILEVSEEAIVLGTLFGRLYYRLINQKSEGSSLSEGGGRAWFWDESEVVDDGILLIGNGKGMGIKLPLLDRFCASSGILVVYSGGAVVRSDLEIFDGSSSIGIITQGTIITQENVLERRINSCGVVRFRIKHEPIGEGWISSRIRGGKEEPIVEPFHETDAPATKSSFLVTRNEYIYPEDAALAWLETYQRVSIVKSNRDEHDISTVDEFESLLLRGTIQNSTPFDSDCCLASAVSVVSDQLEVEGAMDASFFDIASAICGAFSELSGQSLEPANHLVPPPKAILARVSMLRALNRRLQLALPWLPIQPIQEKSSLLGGVSGFGVPVDKAGKSRHDSHDWFILPTIAVRVRTCRRLIFTSVKKKFYDALIDSTTTPTQLSHDEYELPRDIKTVRINRLKARRSDHANKTKSSIFTQLYNEMKSWSGAALRRGFVAKGHGGQKRAFKVKLIGEGVNDYSGPYREIFTDAIREVSEYDVSGRSHLGVLEPSPNHVAEVGSDRELFIFSTGVDLSTSTGSYSVIKAFPSEDAATKYFSSLLHGIDESSRDAESRVAFLGRMAATATRHLIPLDFNLPLNLIWKRMVEEPVNLKASIQEVALLMSRIDEEEERKRQISFLLSSQQRMLNAFVDGFSGVLPLEVLGIMTGEELQGVVCGNPDVDVELLRRVTKYENYNETDPVVKHFWEVLREMTSQQRKRFLQFVWARRRLPRKASEFDSPFRIVKDVKSFSRYDDILGCEPLPSASTCFFSLTLPEYRTKEILRNKLLFAIENVCTMESDYITNDAEVGEGWKEIS